MNQTFDETIVQRARRPALAPLWDELARRMGSSLRPVARIRLCELTHAERVALADLFASDRLPAPSVQVPTSKIARAFRVDQAGLRRLVEELRGPLHNRAAERAARRADRDALWAWLDECVACWPLADWVGRVRAGGIPQGDVAAHRLRLASVVTTLEQLPASGEVLSVLARSVTGDPHGLDWGSWTAARVLDALAVIHDQRPPTNAQETRELWDRAGVVPDKHSVGVTVLGLRSTGTDPLSTALSQMADEAEPVAITLSQLQRWPVTVTARAIYLFENASVLSYATQRGWSGPPLICTAGWPNTAVFVLCEQLRANRALLYHHGDFDPAGIEITRYLAERAAVRPWHMNASDYRELAPRSATQFECPVADTPWDPGLAEVMRTVSKVVYEEDAVAELLASLAPVPVNR